MVNFEKDVYQRLPIYLQTFLLNVKAGELYLERYGKKFRDRLEEFEKNQCLTESELHELQSKKLSELIEHAYATVPYYHEEMRSRKLKPNDIKTIEDIKKLPILTREIIKKEKEKLISNTYPKKLLRKGHTSGTTGSPLDFFYDIQTCVVHHVAVWRQKKIAGMKLRDGVGIFQGRVIVPMHQKKPPFWRKNLINNELFFSAFHLTESNLPYYFDKMADANILFLEGYPSHLYILALYLLKNKKTFPVKAIFTSSETLFPSQREIIEKAFQCRIFDYYGMAERTVFATECAEHSGHHLNSDYGITEFLDSKHENVGIETIGKIVATSLWNYAMPFIRYETNDSCKLIKKDCFCGSKFQLMDDVATKNESIITLPDGRLISPSVLTHPFKPMHNIVASQIVQETIDELKIKIVKNTKYSETDEIKLLSAFAERLGNQITLKIEYVNSIPKTESGKFRWVISKIKPTF